MNTDRGEHKSSLIYLTGFMGSGKSTIGPILANVLGYEYLDLDQLIEQKMQRSVTQIFQEFGEERFRALEYELLRETARRDQCVVSVGGGTLTNERNVQVATANGIIVCLAVSPAEIMRRMKNKVDRPLLRSSDGERLSREALEERIRELLGRRERYYAMSDIVVSTENKRVGATVDEIVRRMAHFPQKKRSAQ